MDVRGKKVDEAFHAPFAFFILGFSLLSEMEFFVVPKNGMSETKNHLLCRWNPKSYTIDHLSVYNIGVQAIL